MSHQVLKILSILLDVASLLGCVYLATAVALVSRFVRRPLAALSAQPSVSVMKPLCGHDPGLLENLQSFADQGYPRFEIVCGVQNPEDAAIPVVERLKRERPHVPITLVVDTARRGGNLKVANLMNMLPSIRHDRLIMVDSDMRVPRNFLATVTAPLEDPGVGLVTSLYRGRPADSSLPSFLGAQYINYAFLPQALLGEVLRPGQGCFGASIGMTRQTLAAIGGLEAVAGALADDNALGSAVRRIGKRIVVSDLIIDDWVSEPSLGGLFRHELRWALTIRGVAPWGYLGSFVTHPVMLGLLGACLAGFGWESLAVLGVALLGRFAMVRATDRALGLEPSPLWLVPLRDALSFGVFLASYFTRTVAWRNRTFHVDRQGQLTLEGDSAA
ncbi:MAG TPA: bacteriohopanetetrol glucosamine biosynthesis glycosyltransferase HpnI [Stellaceae bacterium]|nr:bacteriohopanetetrol glucosamine biosynthesis glycosyltransferase HpnI [Stellaceae bacterium]